ncbi:amino acid ABC transporter ATP-binding protein [Martelella mediterranea]|uniref:Amino acid ABC transporter ATP-binding protein (PAAT family) n=1 Tax=Martelella mediterranea TaxID=293089 RepID=A0A4R3NE69_9HYPH|nr:amino acid ABC transporter ATP-binding protein [Martelella mediterranea]TCT27708.1 amino acid ABC transporter ATP-binding protein (PAAT family) [Martelella mediterranea]
MTILASTKAEDGFARSDEKPVIELKAIHKSFGHHEVLAGIDLSVHAGEVLSIVGPSGSGKSTLLRCINLLETPTNGHIDVCGTRIDAGKPIPRSQITALRRHLGMVFQSFNLFPHMTALENVSFAQKRVFGRSTRDADENSLKLLEKVGLADKAEQYPSRCSGGQQQRIAIARALAMEPRVMLFDEPTSALDPELGLEVLQVMRDLAEQGMTMIVVTHEMAFAEEVAEETIFMADARIIEQGSSTEVIRNPQTERANSFFHAVNKR